MRYGRLKAGGGPDGKPWLEDGRSKSAGGRGDAAAPLGDGDGALVTGGGFIGFDRPSRDGMIGSGSGRISRSSADEVSMVMFLVGALFCRSV